MRHHSPPSPEPPPAVRLAAGPVILRLPTDDDIDGIVDQCRDPETAYFTTIPQPYNRTDAETFVRDAVPTGWASDSRYTFAIADATTDDFLGSINISPNLNRGPGAAEIGFGLRASARGRGVMTSAVRRIATWAFTDLDQSYLMWRARVGNWSSRRVAWATGFRMEGMIRGFGVYRGVRADSWVATLQAGDPMTPRHPWFEAVLLGGDGVVLRPFRENDADACVEACTDPATRRWLGNLPSPYTKENAIAFIRSREEEHAAAAGITWCAADAETDRCVGSFGLMHVDGLLGSAEVGYWVHPAARGRGLATSAVRLLARHAGITVEDGGLGLRRLYLRVAASNPGSQRVAEKAGFEQVGRERHAERLGDGTFDDLLRFDRVL